MATSDRQVVLGMFAHPDDAEILCGGTLIRLCERGWEVHIATVAAGDCGSMSQSPREIASIRAEEARKAAESIGATHHSLGLPDLQVIFDHESNRRAIDLFRRINPSLVFTHPRHDYMLDHEQVHLLARSAAFAFGAPNASLLPSPPNAAVPHLYLRGSGGRYRPVLRSGG